MEVLSAHRAYHFQSDVLALQKKCACASQLERQSPRAAGPRRLGQKGVKGPLFCKANARRLIHVLSPRTNALCRKSGMKGYWSRKAETRARSPADLKEQELRFNRAERQK